MVTVIAEHSVDLDLLPERANIADFGCRGFLFSCELARLGHNVYPVDIDLLTDRPMRYYRFGIGGFDGQCDIMYSKDPQATRMTPGFGIPMLTIKSFAEHVGVAFFDIIKMDIEGEEYPVIMSLTSPPAKQISWEAHLHTGVYGDAQVKEMEDKLLSLGYYPAQHDKTSQHGMGMNYWNSLWILQDY